MFGLGEQLGRHIIERHYLVHKAAGGGAVRHAAHRHVIVFGLCHGQTAILIHFTQFKRPICAGFGKDYAYGVFTLALGQRKEKRINWFAMRPWGQAYALTAFVWPRSGSRQTV